MIPQRIPSCHQFRAALLLFSCIPFACAVELAIPAVADLEVTENNNVSGARPFNATDINALFNTSVSENLIHTAIVLKFDLTGQNRTLSSSAKLKLINYRNNSASGGGTETLHFYGVIDGSTGTTGSYTDDDWPENGTTYTTTPGLNFDSDSTTQDLDISKAVDLGSVVLNSPNANKNEGTEATLAVAALNDFIVNHPDDIVTILVVSDTNPTNLLRFATKESTHLFTDPMTGIAWVSGGTVVTPGTYAPKLVLDVPPTAVFPTVADAQGSENATDTSGVPATDSGSGTGTILSVRYSGINRNEVVALRFDYTSASPGDVEGAEIRLVNYKENNASSVTTLQFYGVLDGATGRDAFAVPAVEATQTENDWVDATTGKFSKIPGLEFDANSITRGLIDSRVTSLGTATMNDALGNKIEGNEVVFSSPAFITFLKNHPNRIVTILVLDTLSGGQKQFCSRESIKTQNGSDQAAGTYAPTLNLIITPGNSFAISNITLGSGTNQITLTWESQPGQVFNIKHSQNLIDGFPGVSATGINADAVGTTTTHLFANPVPGASRLFFRVERP